MKIKIYSTKNLVHRIKWMRLEHCRMGLASSLSPFGTHLMKGTSLLFVRLLLPFTYDTTSVRTARTRLNLNNKIVIPKSRLYTFISVSRRNWRKKSRKKFDRSFWEKEFYLCAVQNWELTRLDWCEAGHILVSLAALRFNECRETPGVIFSFAVLHYSSSWQSNISLWFT